MNSETLLQRLRSRLPADATAGTATQHTMAPPLRGTYANPPADARRAAVLATLYPIDGILHLLFIERTRHPGDRHGGQISFPGGSVEARDEHTAATALREAEEEVGIPRDDVELLGPLTPLYIPVSNFLVDPYVGYLPHRPALTRQESEVAATLEIPLSEFLRPDARRVAERKLASGLTLPEVPFWDVAGHQVWGATSMMTAELISLLKP